MLPAGSTKQTRTSMAWSFLRAASSKVRQSPRASKPTSALARTRCRPSKTRPMTRYLACAAGFFSATTQGNCPLIS
eukprot:6493674-Lingulodinium_polyedra.AAC.1